MMSCRFATVLALAAATASVGCGDGASARFHERYRQLKIGMTLAQARGLLGSPACVVKLRSGVVAYWATSYLWDQPEDDPAQWDWPERVATLASLWKPYGAVQALFAKSGSLVAYTRIGEEVAIHTARGRFRGDRLDQLDSAFLDELIDG